MIRWTLLALLGLGCGRVGAPEPPGEHADDAHGHAEGEAHEDDAAEGILEVSEDLGRDLRVTTAVAQSKAGDERVALLGEVRVHEDALAEVGSPVSARIVRVLVQSGQAVRAGEPLVELESVELGRARAELLGARARLAQADATLVRKRGLAEVASSAEVQTATAEAGVALAEVRAAEGALGALGAGATLGEDVDGRLTLRAPIAGSVLLRAATRGQVVDAEEVLFRIGDLSRLQVEVHAFERDAVRLVEGGEAEIDLSALPGVPFAGRIERIGKEVETESRTIPVRVGVPNDGRIRPGMAATARLDIATAGELVAVPSGALQRLADGWVVFVPRGEDAFDIRPVGRGRDLGGDVEVLSGLAAGDTVVVDGAFLLKAEAEKRSGGGGGHEH